MTTNGALLARLERTLQTAGLDPKEARAILTGDSSKPVSKRKDLALVLIDADAVQRMILASPRPVTILGASLRLAAWDRRWYEGSAPGDLAGVTVLFAGGGTALLLAPHAKADDLIERSRAAFAREMDSTLTGAALRLSPHEIITGPQPLDGAPELLARLGIRARAPRGQGFGACLQQLNFMLQRKKREARDPLHAKPLAGLRCAECVVRAREPGTTLCRACRDNRQRGGKDKSSMEQARTFDELFEDSRRLAFLCIDGSGIGSRLAALGSIEQYSDFSARLHDAFESLHRDDIRAQIGLREDRYVKVLAGGDDLLLVVPATGTPDAFTLTVNLLDHIERAFADSPWSIGAGAGIVITSGLSADFAFQYARELCASAKAAIDPEAKGSGADRSAVDFEILLGGSPISSSVAHLRTEDLLDRSDPERANIRRKLQLGQRPYPLSRFRGILQSARKLRSLGVPTSQTIALRRAFTDEDLPTALVTTQYQAARHPALREALGVGSLGGAPLHLSSLVLDTPAGAPGNVVATAIPDLIEIARVVSP